MIIFNSIILSKDLITPIPTFNSYSYDKQKAILGQELFNDTQLSKNNAFSCASCHFLDDGGDDNIALSLGLNGKQIPRNSPTIFNSIFNVTQHWDGAYDTLREQAKASIKDPLAMASNFKHIINTLSKDKNYINKFKKIYKSDINEKDILDAIVEFEKALITPNSKFDKYLKGDLNILNNNEINGYKLFKEYGCISCHNGINVGGNLIQKSGIFKNNDTKDLGRYYISKNLQDKYYFKVPSLRNIELTAPYFHNGKIYTLRDAVEQMLTFQVGYILKNKDIDDIVLFLNTLTGQKPEILRNK